MTKLFNAFSLQMRTSAEGSIYWEEISVEDVRRLLADGIDSYVGHVDMANVISSVLGLPVPAQRRYGKINKGETIVVAQYDGGRLPEGATELPEGAKIVFLKVTAK